MDQEAKIETDAISNLSKEHTTPSENKVVEIDAGVYFEVKTSEIIEEKEKLEEELITHRNSSKNRKSSSGSWPC